MNEYEYVSEARYICFDAHKGQLDRAGKAYYLHPEYVANRMDTAEKVAAAYLHDVVEDGHHTLDELRQAGIPETVVEAVALLTHDKSEPYMDYVKRIKENDIARAVKIMDLSHNMDLTRLKSVSLKDVERCRKYLDALQILLD